MTRIVRWNPFREMTALQNSVDRVFEGNLLYPSSNWMNLEDWGLALDIAESEDEFIVKASLPGINPDDLDITQNAKTLTIKGEMKEEKEDKSKRYHLRERRYGSFSRTISLPSYVKTDAIDAEYDAGVLTIRLPKSEEAKPKQITIKKVDTSKMIDSGE